MEIYLTIEAMVDNDIKDLLSDDDELSSLRSAYRHTDCFGPQTHGEASNAAAAANGLETVLPPSLNLTVDPDTDGANGGQDGIPERRRHGSDAGMLWDLCHSVVLISLSDSNILDSR